MQQLIGLADAVVLAPLAVMPLACLAARRRPGGGPAQGTKPEPPPPAPATSDNLVPRARSLGGPSEPPTRAGGAYG